MQDFSCLIQRPVLLIVVNGYFEYRKMIQIHKRATKGLMKNVVISIISNIFCCTDNGKIGKKIM